MKIRIGEEIGIETVVHRFETEITEEAQISEISKAIADPASDGVIIQLPLPKHLKRVIS